MYELYLEVKDFNPDCEFVGIKTDCLVFNNITHDPPTSNKWGDIKKHDVPLIKEFTVNQEKKLETCMNQLTPLGILSRGHRTPGTKITRE